jgi:hypothetical protein
VIIVAFLVAFGALLLFKAQWLRDRMVALYHHPRITRHLHMRGYIISMRLVGGGLMAFLGFAVLRSTGSH